MSNSKKRFDPKRANISMPFLALLVLASLVLMSWYHIQKTNYLQHQLLQDTYRLKIMLEVANLQLQKNIHFEEKQMNFPSQITFNCGEVQITWDEQQSCFHLRAELPNHGFRDDTIFLRIKDIEK